MRLAELRALLARRHRRLRERPDEAAPPPDLPDPRHAAAHPAAPAGGLWTPLRLQVAELLWGQGFLLPGGATEMLRLAAPLGLSAASSLLLLGAGSGGTMIRLAGELGVWVRGYEADPFLADTASRRVQRAGVALAKRATVDHWDPAAPDFPHRLFHHALAAEALRVTRPEDALAALARAIRPGGQVAVLQTVVGARRDADAAAWRRLDPRPLPEAEAIGRTLVRLGLEVRVAEDVSARHMHAAVIGWRDMLRGLKGVRPEPALAAAMVAEAEHWLRRIALMRAGGLRVVRWLALDRGKDPT